MRVLLLILLFVIWESAEPPPPPLVVPSTGVMGLVVGYCLLVAAMGFWGRRVARHSTSYDQLGRRVDGFNLGMAIARGLIPAWFAIGVFALGWRGAVDHLLRRWLPGVAGGVVTPGVVVGLFPAMAAWAGLWWSQYPVDRAVREQGVLALLDADLPVFAPPPFAAYFANKLRVQILFTTVPVLLILALRDVATVTMRATGRPVSEGAESGIAFGAVAVVLLTVPVVLRRVLDTRPLPDGRLRSQLAGVLRLAGVRCRQILLWDTNFNVGNAAVMGVVPHVRYVLLSDLLLESMTDEHVQAVFAHELGHVRHRHLAWFVGVLGSALAALSVAADWAAVRLHPTSTTGVVAVQVGLLVALVAVVAVGYGTLSRWFERQADVYAVRLMDRTPGGGGAVAFTGALHRVAVVNNVPPASRNWTHGSIDARVAFVDRLAADPAVGLDHDRAVRRVRAGLVLLMLGCAAVGVVGLWRG